MNSRTTGLLAVLWASAFALIGPGSASAAVTVTGASGGGGISADTAGNGSSPAWTTLGAITIAEGANGDFAAGTNVTLVIKAPVGFEFNTAIVPDVTFTAGNNISGAAVAMTDAATLTLTLTISGTTSTDTLTLGGVTGIQVRPTAGSPLATGKHIYRPSTGGGTATITGITASADGSTGSNFGSLIEVAGSATSLQVETAANGSGTIVPGQSVAAGTSITAYAIARDAFGNFVANAAADVGGWSLGNATGGVAGGDLVPAGDRKSAVFTGHLVGSANILATSGALAATESGLLTVVPALANKLVITTQPSSTAVVGVPFAQQPVIYVEDAYNNICNTNSTVTAVRLGGTGTLQGTTSIAAVGGVATFTNLAHSVVATITIFFNSGSLVTATSQAITVNPGPFSQLQVLLPGESATPGVAPGKSGTPTAQAAGAAFTVRVSAVDATWNPINTVTDTVGITSSDVTAILPANAALVNGTNSFSVTLKVAGSQTVTATDTTTGSQSGVSSAVTVNATAFAKLQLLLPGETPAPGTASGKTGTPTTRTAGTAFTVTVNGVDTNWNKVTSLTGSSYTIHITASDANATLPADANLSSGTQTFSVTFKTAGSATVTASDVDDGTKSASTSSATTVNAGALTKLQLLMPGESASPGTSTGKLGTPSAQKAGTAFNVTVNAVDANWNVVNTNDTVYITSSDTNATLPGLAALVGGTQTFTVTLNTAGSRTVTAANVTHSGITANTSPAITVSADGFAKLQLLMPGETAVPGTLTGKSGTASAQVAGTAFNVTVNAVDTNWNLVSTNDTVAITSSDPNATLPANAALSGGSKTFSVTYKTSGTQTVTVSDVTHTGIMASTGSAAIVNAGAFVKLQLMVPGETPVAGSTAGKTGAPYAESTNNAFSVTVNSVDANWNIINTNDTIRIQSSDASAVLPANAPLVAGTGTFSVALVTLGSSTLTASDVTHSTKTANTSPAITVNGKLAQTITFGAISGTLYGAVPLTLSATASSSLPVTFSVLSGPATVSANTLTLTGAGTVTVGASQAGNSSYNPASDVVRSFIVSPAPLTVTADNKSRPYGAANPALTAGFSGFVNGENAGVLSGVPSLTTTANAISPTGSYPIVAAAGTLSAANYSFTFVNGNLTVTVPTGLTTNTINFAYANRAALLADGWSFWATNNGVGRNTEITDTNIGPLISYNPPDKPGVLRIPVDTGTILETANNSRNSLFRSLPTNWVSMRLALSFWPTQNWQDAHLDLYQDDDNYISVHHRFSGDERVGLAREATGLLLSYHAVNIVHTTATNMTLRMDRDPETDLISGSFSLDGITWVPVASFYQAFPNPRVGIVVGDSSGGFPNCDLVRLDIVTSDNVVPPALIVQPQHLVFNCVAGQPCTNIQALNVVLKCRQSPSEHWSLANSAPAWLSTSVSAGDTPSSCDVSVNSTGLAPGSYEAALSCSAPGAASAVANVTLIVNTNSRISLATWHGAKAGAMCVVVDDSYPTAFDDLVTNGLTGSYVMWLDAAPPYLTTYYQAGMELGSHTMSHPCVPVFGPEMRGEIEGNIAGLITTTPVPQAQVIYFAWPCGVTTPDEEVVAADYFLGARGYNLNQLEDPTPHDFMNVKSFNSHEMDPHVYNPAAPPNPADLKTEVDAAIAQGKWFNLVLHSMDDSDGAIAYSLGKDIWVAPFGSVVKYILQRDRTVITNYVENTNYIQFGCYRLPLDSSSLRSFEIAISTNDVLTFKVGTSGLTQVSAVFVNGLETSFTNSGSFLSFNALVTTNTQNVILDLQPNTAPTLATQTNRTINELTTLVVTNTATDTDFPAQTLTYALAVTNTFDGSLQTNAVIDSNGVISWTPTEAQGPGSYAIITVVTDSGTPALSATNIFAVTVNEVNVAPVLPLQADVTVYGANRLVVTNTATDADIPANPLSYTLAVTNMLDHSVVANAAIDANGVIAWSPTLAQVPSTNLFTTVVTDMNPAAVNAQSLSATNTFIVGLLTDPLVLPAQTNRTINELTALVVTNTASVLTNLLSSGWIATNTIAFNYTNRDALLSDGWSFWATNNGVGRNTEVIDTNMGIVLYAQTNASLGLVMRIPCGLGDLWSAASNNTTNSIFRAAPTNWLSARLRLAFQPTQSYEQAHLVLYQDDDNYVEVGCDYNGGEEIVLVQEILGQPSVLASAGVAATVVSLRLDRDPGNGAISAYYSVDGTNWVSVGQAGQAPINGRLGIWTGGATVPYSSTGVNCDLSRLDIVTTNTSNPLTYALMVTNTLDNSIVTNAMIDTDGIITWTPNEAQGPGVYAFTITSTDNRVPPLFANNSFTVTVNEVNTPPVLTLPDNTNIVALVPWSAPATATDADIPANPLTFALVSGPLGLTVDSSGLISWTPNQTQGATTNTVIISVTDTNPAAVNSSSLSATGSFQIVVAPVGLVLTVTADNQSRAYGTANPALTGTLLGVQDGDNITATYTTTANAGSSVGTYAIVPVLNDPDGRLANYVVVTNNGTLTVNPAGLTITANDQTKAYGAALPGLTVGYSGFVNGDTAGSLTTAPTVATTGTAGSAAGTYAITASGAVDANYTISYVAGTLTVNPVGLAITANDQTKAYGAALPGMTVGYSGFVNGDTAGSLTTAPTVATTGTAGSAAGTYAITASGAVDANYTISYVSGTLTVNPVGLVITANDQTKAYGAALPGLTVGYSGFVNGDTASSLTTAPTVATTGTAGSAAGTYPITASGAVDGNYTISYVAGTLTVNPVGLTVVAEDATRAYGETNPVFTATYVGFVNGETNTVLGGALVLSSPAQTNSPVGSYPITASGLSATNYSLTYSNGTLSVLAQALTVTAQDQTKVYGAADPGFTAVYSGLVNGESNAVLGGTLVFSREPGETVGSYAITPAGLTSTNYAITYANGTLTINPAALTITANDQTKAYGAALPGLTVGYSGFVNGDTASSLTTAPTVATTGTAGSAVGTYPITASGAVDANYTISYVAGTLTVNPVGLVITANDQTKAYGAALPGLTVGYSGFVNGDTAGSLTTAPTVATTGTAGSAAGTYAITASGAVDANYTISYVAGTLTVNPVGLVITANDQTKAYGAALPGLTVGYSGFVNGDTASSLTTAPTVATTGTAGSAAGTYPITASGAVDGNYTISYVAGTLTVNPVGLTVVAEDATRAYGETNPVFTATYVGFVNGETNTVLGGALVLSSPAQTNSPVGSYPITASGLSATNYSLTYSNGTLSVLAQALTVTAQDQTKVYGAADPGFTAVYSGLVNGESNAVLGGTLVFSREPGETVGSYAITPAGLTSTNYAITYANGTLTINPAALTITANDQTKAYGAALPGLTVGYSGFVNGDTASSLTTAPTVATTGTAGSAVGTYPITASGAVDANYTISYVAGTLTVNPVGLVITANDQTKAYGAALPGMTVGYSGFVNGDTASSLTTAPTVATTGTAGSTAGTYPITASGAVDANYTISYVAGTLTVNPVGLVITANDQTKAYGAALPGLTVGYSGFVNGDTASSLTTAPTVATTGTAGSAVGTYPITASGAVDANYTISYVGGTLTVNPAALTITANDQTKAYGAALPGLTVGYSGFVNGDTASSLTTAPTVATTGTAGSAVGTYAITASGAVDANYTISYVSGTLTVNPVGLTVVAGDATRAYGQTNPVFTATYVGFVNGETNTVLSGALVLSSPAQTNSPVGSYPITASGLSATNYSLTYSNGTLSVLAQALTVTAQDQTKVYGAADPGFTVAYSGLVNGESSAVLGGTLVFSRVPGETVGSYAITPAGLTSTNYAITYANGTLTINPAALTITANDQAKAYGAALPGLTVGYSGFVNGDTAGSLTTAPTVTTTGTAGSAAGTYPITASGAVDANYTISYVPGTLTVNPVGLTITANDQTKAYGAALPGLTVGYSGFVNGDTARSLTTAPTVTTTGTAGSAAGTYPITASGAVDANYTISYVGGTLTVNPVGLVITANDQTKAYGAALPGLTVGYSGFVNGDTASSLTTAPTVATTGTAGSAAGTYPITASGAVDANYTISYVAGTLTVNPVGLVITANDQTKAYGAALPGMTVGYSGFVNGDTASSLTTAPTVATTGTAGSAAGTYPITASGAVDGNYTISYVAGTLTVNPVGLTVVAEDATRAYGETNPVFTATYMGFVNGETNTVLGGALVLSSPAGTNSPVGEYPITASGLSATNYSLTYSNGTLMINPALLTVTADSQTKWYGQTDPVLTYLITGGGLVNGDRLSGALSRVAGENAGIYAILQGTLAASTNYTLAYVGTNLTIWPDWLTVTADDQSRAYGAANPMLTISYAGFVGADGVTNLTELPQASTIAQPNSPVGDYEIVLTGGGATNYRLTLQSGTLTVTPAELTVMATNATRIYGAANPVFGGSITGIQNGDDITANYATTATETSPPGTYPIVPTLIDPGQKLTNYAATVNDGTLTVTPAPNPTILSIKPVGNTSVVITWTSISNSVYRVQYKANLASTNWINLAPDVTATASTTSFTDYLNGAPQRYYRVVFLSSVTPLTPLVVVVNDASRVYGSTNPSFSGTIIGLQSGDNITATYGTTATPKTYVGTYPITPTLIDPNGRLASYSVTITNGALTIRPAELTVVANDASRAYGATNPVFSGTITGLQNDDSLGITATYATAATVISPVGTYPIFPTLADTLNRLGNYSMIVSNGTLTVTSAALMVTANDASRPYGAANPVFSGTITGIQNSDNISATYTTTATVSSPPGTYPIVPSVVDAGSKGFNDYVSVGNYDVSVRIGTLTVTAPIRPRILSIIDSGNSSVVITWSSVSNSVYQVQYNAHLGNSNWVTLTPDVTAAGSTASFTDHPAGVGERYYHIALLP